MELTLVDLINKLESATIKFKDMDLVKALKELSEIKGYYDFKNTLAMDIDYIIKNGYKKHNIILKFESDNDVKLNVAVGKIFNILYYDNYHNIKIFSREDLVDIFVGWTSLKVNKLLTENLNQVILINLENLADDKSDHFGIEALNTLSLFKNNYSDRITFIFFGNKNKLEEGIFELLPGFKRKCSFHYCYCK